MSRLDNFTMYAKDRQAAAALVSMKVQGNAGPEIDRKVRVDLVNLRTVHMEYDPCSKKGRLPAYFARVFGIQVAPFVMLRDPNLNEIEVAVEKKNGRVYFTHGWEFLRNYYGIGSCAWVTLIYANRHLFLMEVRNLHGQELNYPQNRPAQRLFLENDRAGFYRGSGVPYGPSALFLPTRFYHTIVKVLTAADVASGMLKVGWVGFCQHAFPAERTELTLIDYFGCVWKIVMDFCQAGGMMTCVFSGEWRSVCRSRKLVEGTKIKLGVTDAANNKVVYMCPPPMVVLRSKIPPSSGASEDALSYRIDHYFWTN